MKYQRKSYQNSRWHEFSKIVKDRDGYKCLKCGRQETDVILQVHHQAYKLDLKPWEYPFSDCITLCKGCHARQHNLIEPDSGWMLVSIEDLGELDGICERKGCGHEIRYEHLTYHPGWGYKTVGSTCVEYLTEEDKFLSQGVLKLFKKISDFVGNSIWESGETKNGSSFISTKYAHHKIRIYGKENSYAFQVILKTPGQNDFDYQDIVKMYRKPLYRVKELGFIMLKGFLSDNEEEKKVLRNIYRRTVNSK